MKKLFTLSIVSILTFLMGEQGVNAPNKKAPLFSKIQFAGSMNNAFAASSEEDAGAMAEGLWEFLIDSGTSGNESVYEFIASNLDGLEDEMTNLGYTTCSAIPTSGSVLLAGTSNVTITYSVGDKLVPAGSNWSNSGSTYDKKIIASVAGNDFAEVQFDCAAHTNIYHKYDFNQFESKDRVAEFYLQKGANGKISLDMQTTCLDVGDCGTRESIALSFHTPDGDELKVIGVSAKASSPNQVKGISLHAIASSKIADIHFIDHVNLSSADDMDPVNATVTGVCVDFDQATYVPPTGSLACSGLGISANNALVSAESDAFGIGNITPSLVNSLNVIY